MNKLIKITAGIFFVAILFSVLSCEPEFTGEVKDGIRDITIDVDNSIFRLPSAENVWEQGPGMVNLTVTVVLESQEVEIPLNAEDAGAGAYTQLTKEISGKLVRIEVKAENASGAVFNAVIEDKANYDSFTGWEIFSNVTRFRISYQGSRDNWADGFLTLDIAPCGGTGIQFKFDSGVTASENMKTDWGGAPLQNRQIAVEPVLSENPNGLEFDIYTLIVDENLREKYKPEYLTVSANYEYHPWTDVWTMEEVTVTGKLIGNKTYKLEKYNKKLLSYIEPTAEGCGYNSFIIDLSSVEDEPTGKYLLVVLVSQVGTLSVTSETGIVEIR